MFWLKDRTVLICAQANPMIGTGCVRRCLALAEALKQIGIPTQWLASELPPVLEHRIRQQFQTLHTISMRDSTNPFQWQSAIGDFTDREKIAWVVLDGPSLVQQPLRIPEARVLQFAPTKFGNIRPVFASDTPSEKVLDEFGYTIVEGCGNRRAKRSQVFRLVWQWTNETSIDVFKSVVQSLRHRHQEVAINMLVTDDSESLRKAASEIDDDGVVVQFIHHADRWMASLSGANTAILNCGQWLADCNVRNVPVVYFRNEANAELISEFARQHAVSVVDLRLGKEAVKTDFSKVVGDSKSKKNNITRLYDDHAANRIVRAMMADMFQIRDCCLDDSQLLLDWRNDSEFRANNLDSDYIDVTTHFADLKLRLNSNQFVTSMIEDERGRCVGKIELNYEDDFKSVTLNLLMVPSLRGIGLGTAMIERVCRSVWQGSSCETINAEFSAQNQASQSAFRKAGFERVGTSSVGGQVAFRFAIERPGEVAYRTCQTETEQQTAVNLRKAS